MNRRKFVKAGVLSAGSAALGSCSADGPGRISEEHIERSYPAKDLDTAAVLDLAEATAKTKLAICHHCAQSTFLALQEVFGLEGDDVVKALTPLPGLAERGETCGAVTGGLLSIGLVFGRERLTDWEGWRASLVPARAFCDAFVSRFGSTSCVDVLECQFGRRYDLYDPDDLVHFQASDPTEKCGEVVGAAARYAAEQIHGGAG